MACAYGREARLHASAERRMQRPRTAPHRGAMAKPSSLDGMYLQLADTMTKRRMLEQQATAAIAAAVAASQ